MHFFSQVHGILSVTEKTYCNGLYHWNSKPKEQCVLVSAGLNNVKKINTSAASSRTKFMYSSNPTMCPSILVLIFSYNQTWTRVRFCKGSIKNYENHEDICLSRVWGRKTMEIFSSGSGVYFDISYYDLLA